MFPGVKLGKSTVLFLKKYGTFSEKVRYILENLGKIWLNAWEEWAEGVGSGGFLNLSFHA